MTEEPCLRLFHAIRNSALYAGAADRLGKCENSPCKARKAIIHSLYFKCRVQRAGIAIKFVGHPLLQKPYLECQTFSGIN